MVLPRARDARARHVRLANGLHLVAPEAVADLVERREDRVKNGNLVMVMVVMVVMVMWWW